MFQASIDVQLGDGCLALFWADRWYNKLPPCVFAPDLCALIRPRERKRRTVAEATHGKQWIRDIVGLLTIPAIVQYIKLWRVIEKEGVHLQAGTEDRVAWRWSSSQTYTAHSAYRMFFEGSVRLAAARPIWKVWAPLKVTFFTWLAVCGRIWTADRRH